MDGPFAPGYGQIRAFFRRSDAQYGEPVDPDALAGRLRAGGCVFAEDEAALLIGEGYVGAGLEDAVRRRVAGEPLEQVLGWAEFCGLRLHVAPGAFVPRRRTELLVREARAILAVSPGPESAAATGQAHPVVVDLCCGVGAVAAALVAAFPDAQVHASDLDPVAVDCARRNLAGASSSTSTGTGPSTPGAEVHAGDLFDALPQDLRSRIDVLAVNAPYVPSDEIALMPPEARDHEHRVALDGGPDGLDLHRRIAAAAPEWLAPGGSVLIETSARQAPQTRAALDAVGLETRVASDDEIGGTVVVGRRPVGRRPTGRERMGG